MSHPLHGNDFTVGFSDREVTAWGGLALMKQMLDRLQFREAFSQFGVPEASSNRIDLVWSLPFCPCGDGSFG